MDREQALEVAAIALEEVLAEVVDITLREAVLADLAEEVTAVRGVALEVLVPEVPEVVLEEALAVDLAAAVGAEDANSKFHFLNL